MTVERRNEFNAITNMSHESKLSIPVLNNKDNIVNKKLEEFVDYH